MMPRNFTRLAWLSLISCCLPLLTGCLDDIAESARGALPFLPPPKYVVVRGRRMTREEAAYVQKLRDLADATRVNPKDAVAYNALGQLRQDKGDYALAKDLY